MRKLAATLLLVLLASCGGKEESPADAWSDATPPPGSDSLNPVDTRTPPDRSGMPVSDPDRRLLTRRGSHSYLYFPRPEESVEAERNVVGPKLFWRQHADLVSHLGVYSPLLTALMEFRSLESCAFEKYEWSPSHVVRTYACGPLRVIETTAYGTPNGIVARMRVQNDGDATAFALRGRPGATGVTSTVQADEALPGARISLSGELVNFWTDPVPVTWNVAIAASPPPTSSEVVDEGLCWSLNYAIGEGETLDVVLAIEMREGDQAVPSPLDATALYGLVSQLEDELESWFAAAPDVDAVYSDEAYANAWYLFWENTAAPRGNWTVDAVVPSKRHYFRGVWLWDAAFHALALSQGDEAAINLARNQIDLFAQQPFPDGHLSREIWTADRNPGTQPPGLLTWASIVQQEAAEAAGIETTSLSQRYDVFKANHQWFLDNFDSDGDGLYEWEGTDSGWDTSPRWDNGAVEALDLACWLYLDAVLLSSVAQKLARLEDAVAFSDEAALLKERIQTLFWDPASGYFYDLSIEDNAYTMVKTPATYLPLFVGAATPEQATAVAAHLSDPAAFASPYLLPTVAVTSPDYDSDNYWRGPVWIVLNAMTIWGLEAYGLNAPADALRQQTLQLIAASDTTWEYYDSQTGEGLGAPNFMWSGAFYILLSGESPISW